MTVAPAPIVLLHPGMLSVVCTITPALFLQVTPVSAVFVVIPVVIITVVPIVDSNLDVSVLRLGGRHDCRWCSNSRGQQKGNDVAVDMGDEVVLQIRDALRAEPRFPLLCAPRVAESVPYSTCLKTIRISQCLRLSL